jgi:hypothetical protein
MHGCPAWISFRGRSFGSCNQHLLPPRAIRSGYAGANLVDADGRIGAVFEMRQ